MADVVCPTSSTSPSLPSSISTPPGDYLLLYQTVPVLQISSVSSLNCRLSKVLPTIIYHRPHYTTSVPYSHCGRRFFGKLAYMGLFLALCIRFFLQDWTSSSKATQLCDVPYKNRSWYRRLHNLLQWLLPSGKTYSHLRMRWKDLL